MELSQARASLETPPSEWSRPGHGLTMSAMEIILNGKPYRLSEEATVADLLEGLDLAGRRIALEVNEVIVPRSRYQEHRLAAGDRVEIVHAIGGG